MAEGGLEAMIARFRAIPAAVRQTYPQMADAMLDEIRTNIAAQRTPGGEAWMPSKKGQPVLVNAAKALSYDIQGSTILLHVTGIEARHHFGHFGGVKGGRSRQILPRSARSLKLAQKRLDRIARQAVKDALAGKRKAGA